MSTGLSAADVGAIGPVSKLPGLVAVCAMESLFFQLTCCPTLTTTGFGENTPLVMNTVVIDGSCELAGLNGLVACPQPAAVAIKRASTAVRTCMSSLRHVEEQCRCQESSAGGLERECSSDLPGSAFVRRTTNQRS